MLDSSKVQPEDEEEAKQRKPLRESLSFPGENKTKRNEVKNMAENTNTLFIGVAQIQKDWGISRSKAYQIIKDLNAELKKKNPTALVVAGRVNRFWYEEACLQRGSLGNGNG